MLQPTEALGIACLLMDELAAGVQGRQAVLLGHLLEDIAAFSQVTANRCLGDNARQIICVTLA